MVFLAPFCGKIPLASLAAILIFIAYNMSEMERFHTILRGPRSDRAVLITTYFMTVLFDLTVAAQAGILLAAFLFLKHMSEKTTTTVYQMLQESTEADTSGSSENVSTPQGTRIFEVEGPFFFGVSDMLSESYRQLQEKPRHIILKMKTVPLIDSSGMQALKTFYDKCTKDGVELTIIEVRPDVMRTLQKGGVLSYIGTDHFA
jgi:SulP family sulfate permease